MPAFNAAAHLRAAVDSVLSQTFRDFELLVVDDGSTDATTEILAEYRDGRVRVERFATNRGLSAALNHGLSCATADLIARLDADDVARPERLERQLACFRADAALVLLGSQARALTAGGRIAGIVERPIEPVSIQWYALLDNPFIHSAVMFRRAIAVGAGGYEDQFDPFSQDLALWWKMMKHGTARNLRDCLVDYRVNPVSIIGRLEADDDRAYRDRFAASALRLISRHTIEVFGPRGLTTDEARVLAGFASGIDAAELDRFLTLFIQMLRWFESDYPDATRHADFLATLARQFDAIAYRVRPATRRSTLKVYRRGIAEVPSLSTHISTQRLLAMLAFGLRGRAQLARVVAGIRSRRSS
jgi:glycosyltransferase involved in cell wall biosynthesis